MPIRIKKDKGFNTPSQKRIPSTGNRGRGFGGGGAQLIGALLPSLIALFRKNPKIGIGVLILAVVLFFAFGRGGCSPTGEYDSNNPVASLFYSGLEMDQDVYDQAEVFMPLADNAKNPLPESVSLLKYCPPRKNQGQQGSCVGWASSYGARTILFAKQTGEDPNEVKFSPSYLYNQIALAGCQGSYLQNAMEVMKKEGVVPYSEFAYTDKSCSKQPTFQQKKLASEFKTKGFNRLSLGASNYKTDLLAIKQNLAQGAPVVIGMMVGGSFMSNMSGKELWKPTKSDYDMVGFGGHALCVIGYDDYKEGGAFQIMNSWGEEWGKKGIFWIRYNDFDYFTREAYGLYPMGDAEKFASNKLSAEIGLVLNKMGVNVPLVYEGGITFKTKQPVKKGEEFKIEVTNSIECYVYVFAEETDGSNYVLFPYTEKHSPYCGITGTRVFPHDHSMFADEIGTKDQMAVIVSKQPLDYNKLGNAINSASGLTYASKIQNALKEELVTDIDFKGGDNFSFECKTSTKNTVAVVLEIEKK